MAALSAGCGWNHVRPVTLRPVHFSERTHARKRRIPADRPSPVCRVRGHRHLHAHPPPRDLGRGRIGLVGVPFDIGLNYRSGARQGPAGVREASRVIRRVHPSSLIRPFEICNVADLGDAPVNPMSKDRSIEMIEGFFADLPAPRHHPDRDRRRHTIPLPILRALASDRPVGVLHFERTRTPSTSSAATRSTTRRSCAADTRRGWSMRRG